MKIEEYTQEITNSMMELLLTADPNKKAILEYFSNLRVLLIKPTKNRTIGAFFSTVDTPLTATISILLNLFLCQLTA